MRSSILILSILLTPQLNLTAQAPQLPPAVSAGLEAYKQGGASAALAAWLKGSAIPQETSPTTRAAFEQIEGAYGHFTGYDVLRVVPFGPHVLRSYVVILCERGAVYAWFDSYKGGEHWILTQFLFNTKPDLILPPTMLAP